MAALVAAAVVDAAAGHNGDVRSVGDVEVIVHDIHHTGGAHHHRDMHLLALCIPVYIHIYTGIVFLFLYLDVLRAAVAQGDSVLPEIERALLFKSGAAVYLPQHLFCYLI